MFKKFSSKILAIYNLVFIVIGAVFFFILPNLFNYPPDSLYNDFQKQVNFNLYYSHQYIIVLGLTLILANIFIIPQVKKIDILISNVDSGKKEYINELRNKCINYPYYIYLIQIVMPVIALILVLSFIMKLSYLLVFKISVLIFSFSTLIAIFTYIFCKDIFKNILVKTGYNNAIAGRRIGLEAKIMFQILPLLWIATLFICLLGYSRIVKEKGDLLYEIYKLELSKQNFSNIYDVNEEVLVEKLKNIKYQNGDDQYFIIKPDNSIITNGSELSTFFILYTLQKAESQNMHTYDNYGVDSQGTIEFVFDQYNNKWIVGVKYNTYSNETIFYFIITLLVLSFIGIIILKYFAKDITKDIIEVANYLENIAENKYINLDEKLPVTSNDEIGKLVIAFNKILDLEKNNIEKITQSQDIMVEQERLSSLGQLIGGIAHNLKTPIMSIAGVTEGLTDLIKEYDESIDDPSVTKEDHHEIAKDMQDWVDKVKPYLSYMTEVINTVKGQAVSMNASTMTSFSAKELISRVNILLRNELKRRHCVLNLDVDVNENTSIAGEISAIVQVLDNLVINAMDAYKEDGGNIDIKVREDEDKVYIEVKDYGCGIPQKVQDKLFKEMVTSKGKNGTGLGLYMSFSTIKGKFKGDIRFETEEGRGTTFFIELPKYLVA